MTMKVYFLCPIWTKLLIINTVGCNFDPTYKEHLYINIEYKCCYIPEQSSTVLQALKGGRINEEREFSYTYIYNWKILNYLLWKKRGKKKLWILWENYLELVYIRIFLQSYKGRAVSSQTWLGICSSRSLRYTQADFHDILGFIPEKNMFDFN